MPIRTPHTRREPALPTLGRVQLFVLRPDVVIDLRASATDVAAALPSLDAWDCVELELKRTGRSRSRRAHRSDAQAWLTLREAAALMCRRDVMDEVRRELEIDEAVRTVGRWVLVSVAGLLRTAQRTGWSIERRFLKGAIDAAHLIRDSERLKDLRTRPRWVFSDGTVAYLGGFIEGASLFAREIDASLAKGEIGIVVGLMPCGGKWADRNDLAEFNEWLREEMSKPYRREMNLTMLEVPPNIPPLPRPPPPDWGGLEPGPDVVY